MAIAPSVRAWRPPGSERLLLMAGRTDRYAAEPAGHRWQVARRVCRARGLLERGDTIADVAGATGFVDQSHLHRHLRRSLGVTPGEYARGAAR